MAFSFERISAGLSASLASTVSAIQTFLATNNPVSIVDVEPKFRGKMGNRLEILLTWRTGGASYAAQGFAADATSDATAKANAYFAANPDFRVMHVLDVSNPYIRRLYRDDLIVLGIPDYGVDLHLNRRMVILSADAAIAAGATGSATIVTSNGAVGDTVQVQNRHTAAWGLGILGWAAPDPVTGEWKGYPNCC